MRKTIKNHYKSHLSDRAFLWMLFQACLLLLISLIVSSYAEINALHKESNAVTDIILSNIPAYDVDFIFVYGAIALWAMIITICVVDIKTAPFIVKTVALFVFIRSGFISLTHIAHDPNAVIIQSRLMASFTRGGDLFFSGHTGIPFLLALIFWKKPIFRFIFLVSSVLFGIIVLLGHLHYTIDVVSAFFITYGIHHIALHWFPKEHGIFVQGLKKL